MFNLDKLNDALKLLGARLELEKSSPVDIIVCGGASLIVTGLVTRTTKDVDVLAIIHHSANGKSAIVESAPLPEALKRAAFQVSRDLGLDENWLNCSPTALIKYGLPDGFVERLQTKEYGELLTINFIGRLDQIHFKVYAAVDSGPGRHVDDLLTLKPTESEIELAARWSLTQDPSGDFRQTLKKMLKALKYESVANRI